MRPGVAASALGQALGLLWRNASAGSKSGFGDPGVGISDELERGSDQEVDEVVEVGLGQIDARPARVCAGKLADRSLVLTIGWSDATDVAPALDRRTVGDIGGDLGDDAGGA